jgi:copper(I)-binding protein
MTMRMTRPILFALMLGLAGTALAADLKIEEPWVREAPPGAMALAGYMEIKNPGGEARALVGAESPAFERVELHLSVHEDGMARMIAQESMPIPAGGELELEPGGYHLMLMKPRQTLTAGDSVSMTLRFDDGSVMELEMPVVKAAGGMDHGEHHHHHHH